MSNGIYDYVDDVKERLAEKDKRIAELEEQLKNATKQVRKEVVQEIREHIKEDFDYDDFLSFLEELEKCTIL